MFSIFNWTFNIILGGQFQIKIRGVLGQMIISLVRMNKRIKLNDFWCDTLRIQNKNPTLIFFSPKIELDHDS